MSPIVFDISFWTEFDKIPLKQNEVLILPNMFILMDKSPHILGRYVCQFDLIIFNYVTREDYNRPPCLDVIDSLTK